MEKAIIYVRGNNKEKQEIICRVYAAEVGYKVLFVTEDIEAVHGCDVLIILNPSRISRKQYEYLLAVRKLKSKSIRVESVTNYDNAIDCISLATNFYK